MEEGDAASRTLLEGGFLDGLMADGGLFDVTEFSQ